MSLFGKKKGEVSFDKFSLIIEFFMTFLVFASCVFVLILGFVHSSIVVIFIYLMAILSLLILIYKFLEINKSKIELFENGFIIIKPLKKIEVHKKNIKSIVWFESINLIGPLPICYKCNIKLVNNENIIISSKLYKNLYDKINQY